MKTAQQLQSERTAAYPAAETEHAITGNASDGYRCRPIDPLNRGTGYPWRTYPTRETAEQALTAYLTADPT